MTQSKTNGATGAESSSTTIADAAKTVIVKEEEQLTPVVKKPETAEEEVAAIVNILKAKKAQNLVSVNVGHLTVVAEYFVIASGTSSTAVKALGEWVEEEMSKLGVPPSRTDGIRDGAWAALDFGSVIVHIFHEQTRNIYQLEKLWTDGNNVTEYKD